MHRRSVGRSTLNISIYPPSGGNGVNAKVPDFHSPQSRGPPGFPQHVRLPLIFRSGSLRIYSAHSCIVHGKHRAYMARAAPIQYNRPARKIMIFRGIKKVKFPLVFLTVRF